MKAEQEAARVRAEQEAERVRALQEATRIRAEEQARREAEGRAQALRDLAAAQAKARADAETALQVRASLEADMALAIQRQQVVQDARTVARIEARAAKVERARQRRMMTTSAPTSLRAPEVRTSQRDGASMLWTCGAGLLVLASLAPVTAVARRRRLACR